MAGDEASPARAAALEQLCRAYWQPVCAFARRKGWREEDAKDLTQQFFARLLARNDFRGLDPQRGKFRTFLLTAFAHFLANEYDRVTAQKRGGGQTAVAYDELTPEQLGRLAPPGGEAPDRCYDLEWAQAIMAAALRQLRADLTAGGKAAHFTILKPFLTLPGGATEYAAAARELGVEPASVPVLVHRLRHAFREGVRAEVAQTVATPLELEEEMRHLFAVLNQ